MSLFARRPAPEPVAEMCTCSSIPTPHNPGWCVEFTGAPDAASWDAFEVITLGEWARRLY